MFARLSKPVELEEDVRRFWDAERIFARSLEQAEDRPAWVFYEGPPTANGTPHNGHVLTRVMKDVFPRFRTMRGYRVLRKAGWDTHGLPVEVEVERQAWHAESCRGSGEAPFGGHGQQSVEPCELLHCLSSRYRRPYRSVHATKKTGFVAFAAHLVGDRLPAFDAKARCQSRWTMRFVGFVSSLLMVVAAGCGGDPAPSQGKTGVPMDEDEPVDETPSVIDDEDDDDPIDEPDEPDDPIHDVDPDPEPDPVVSSRCTYNDNDTFDPSYFWNEGPFHASTRSERFVDESRRAGDAEERALPATIHYPGVEDIWNWGPDEVDGGPFPLVIYSHGYSSNKDEAKHIGPFLASHGYIVVAADFPLTNMAANFFAPDIDDAVNQPGDVSFLIDQMLAKSALASDDFYHTIDENRIAVTGVSLGGLTTLLVSYHHLMWDERIRASAPIAAPSSYFNSLFYDNRPDLPVMFVHGDLDAFIHYERNARHSFEESKPHSMLVTVIDGSHAAFGFPDSALIDLAGQFIAPPEAHPDNPDGLGCGFVAERIANSQPESLLALHDPENGVDLEAAWDDLPCQGDEITYPALDPAEQNRVGRSAVFAFFETEFAPTDDERGAACAFLNEALDVNEHTIVE